MSTLENTAEATDLARYKQAAEEFENSSHNDALWYKAFAEGGGNDSAVKAAFIRLRVDQLRREAIADSSVFMPQDPAPSTKPLASSSSNLKANTSLDPVIAAYKKQKARIEAPSSLDAETALPTQSKKPSPLTRQDFYKAYLGETNAKYYLDEFKQFDLQSDGLHISWNWWAALSGGIWWALYRKMYGWFIVLWILAAFTNAILNTIETHSDTHWMVYVLAAFIISAPFSAFANSIYHRKVVKEIADARKTANNEDRHMCEILQQKGGIHSWVLISARWAGWILLALALIGIWFGKDSSQEPAEEPKVSTPPNVISAVPLKADNPQQDEMKEVTDRIQSLYSAKNYLAVVREAESGKSIPYSEYNHIGVSYYNLGLYRKALDIFLIVERELPSNAISKTNTGNAYAALGDASNAIVKYKEAEEMLPNDAMIKMLLGGGYLYQGNRDYALVKFRESLSLDPSNNFVKQRISEIESASQNQFRRQ